MFAIFRERIDCNMKKILLVFGTRPEAIKMAPLVREFRKYTDIFHTEVCVSAQHRQMLDQVLRIFEITPDYDLDIMRKEQDLYDVTSRVLLGMRQVLDQAAPDAVFVHGDTTTSAAAALAAFYKRIPVAHIEAGLRTGNIYSPWPEEMNRMLTGRIATWHFSPTVTAKENLVRENIDPERITVTGNTVIDALQWVVSRIQETKGLADRMKTELRAAGYDMVRLETPGRRLVLITGHRRENFGEGFRQICHAIRHLADRYPQVDFVYPMHLNPQVREPIRAVFGKQPPANVFFVEPLEYLHFVTMMQASCFLLTDSGGIQEEAPGLGKPVLVMRDTTERPEAISTGTVRLVGADFGKIVSGVSELLDNEQIYRDMSHAVNPYGDGRASERIVQKMKAFLL